jgi:hypothetical protein
VFNTYNRFKELFFYYPVCQSPVAGIRGFALLR